MQEDIANRRVDSIDSFYITSCKWPEILSGSTPQDVLFQMDEVMTLYLDCYTRHNSLIPILLNDESY